MVGVETTEGVEGTFVGIGPMFFERFLDDEEEEGVEGWERWEAARLE